MKEQDGDLWIDDHTYFPCYLVDGESEQGLYYQIDVDADLQGAYEPLTEWLEDQDVYPSGYLWQVMFTAWIGQHDPALQQQIGFDSEGETCGLYLRDEPSQFRVASLILTLLNDTRAFKKLFKQIRVDEANEWLFT